MSETPCQPSQPESGHQRTDLADTAADKGTSNPERGTTESRREEVSQFSHPARNAEAQDATSEAETAPDATQSADNGAPAVTTLPDATPAENAISGAMHATGTEAQVCRDIARRQRRGIAKYGVTVANSPLTPAQFLQHFYEELLDASVYAKRILTMTHEPENQTENNGGTPSVLPDGPASVNRHRKPGAGRKAKPCPGCGATKSIGSTVKNGIPTRRCKVCGFVVQTYPHLANVKAAE